MYTYYANPYRKTKQKHRIYSYHPYKYHHIFKPMLGGYHKFRALQVFTTYMYVDINIYVCMKPS